MDLNWGMVADLAASVCFIAGALLTLTAGIGLVRFPSLLTRMHAVAKPQVLGLLLALVGLALRVRQGPALWTLLLVAAFQMLTAPVAAHLVGRAAYRSGLAKGTGLSPDELAARVNDLADELVDDGIVAEKPQGAHPTQAAGGQVEET